MCNHGAKTALAVKSDGENCPRENGSLEVRLLCTGSVDDFRAENGRRVKLLKQEFATLNLYSTYKIVTDPGDLKGTWFSFKDLCQDNGIRKLGDFPSKFKEEEKNCKNSLKQKVQFELWQWKKELSDFGKIYGPIYGDIQTCSHDYECKNANLSVPPTMNNPPQGSNRNHSESANDQSTTIREDTRGRIKEDKSSGSRISVVIHGNVGSFGSVGGKNNKNKIKNKNAQASAC